MLKRKGPKKKEYLLFVFPISLPISHPSRIKTSYWTYRKLYIFPGLHPVKLGALRLSSVQWNVHRSEKINFQAWSS